MSEERVVLSASLKDELSAPLSNLEKKVDGAAGAVERANKRTKSSTKDAMDTVGSSTDDAGKKTTAMADAMEKGTGRASNAFGSMKGMIVGAVTAGATVAIAGLAGGAVRSFAELEDSTAAASVIFGQDMQAIIDQSNGAAKTLGMSQQQVISAANTFGTYGKAAGLAGGDLAGFSTEMTTLAGDMASFKGKSPEEAILAIGSALRGEAEPIREFGVMLDDATLKNRALSMGLISTTKDALTPQQKSLAAHQEILAQTTDAQGDFLRTQDSTANVAKTLAAETENLSAKVGTLLAPAFTWAREKAMEMVSGISEGIDRLVAAKDVMMNGGITPDIVRALGLNPEAGVGLVIKETIGGIFALVNSFKLGGNDITSSGFAGVMEQIGYKARELKDIISAWIADGGVGTVVQWFKDWYPAILGVTGAIAGLNALMVIHAAVMKVQAAGGIAAYIIQMNFAQTAIKAWTALQWALNVALNANPIALVVLAVAALVAGAIVAYDRVGWFRDAVDTAFRVIKDAAANVVNWWNSTLWPAIQTVGRWFADTWAIITAKWNEGVAAIQVIVGVIIAWWNANLAPILIAVGNWFAGAISNARDTWETGVAIITRIVEILIMWWNTTLAPALSLLAAWFSDAMATVSSVVDVAVNWVTRYVNNLVAFWSAILSPAIGAVAQWFSDMGVNISAFIDAAVTTIQFLFQQLTDWWNGTLGPSIDAVANWFREKIGPAVDSVAPYIQGALDNFGKLTSWFNTTLAPAAETIGNIFGAMGEAIEGAAGHLGDFVSNPLGGVADWMGIDRGGDSGGGGFSGGGVIHAAGGSVIGGYAPGKDRVPVMASPGEGIAVPELVRAIGARNFMALNSAFSGGRPAGSGPTPSVGGGTGGRSGGGTTIVIAEGAVQVTVQGGNGPVDPRDIKDAVKQAIEEVLYEAERRSY